MCHLCIQSTDWIHRTQKQSRLSVEFREQQLELSNPGIFICWTYHRLLAETTPKKYKKRSRSVFPYCDGGHSSVSIQELRSPFIYPERIWKSFFFNYINSTCGDSALITVRSWRSRMRHMDLFNCNSWTCRCNSVLKVFGCSSRQKY